MRALQRRENGLGRCALPPSDSRDARGDGRGDPALRAEADENTCRLGFAPSEAVAVAASDIRKAEEEREREGGGDKKSAKAKSGREIFPTRSKRDESARTSSVAAAAVGMDRRTLEKAVVATGAIRAAPRGRRPPFWIALGKVFLEQ